MSKALTELVPILDGTNYIQWEKQMNAFLKSLDLWEHVNGGEPYPVAAAAQPTAAELAAQKAWMVISNRAMGNIMLRVVPTIQDKIMTQ